MSGLPHTRIFRVIRQEVLFQLPFQSCFDNENDLASFVDSITEVQVGNDKKFTKATFSFSFSETEFGTVTENYSVGIKFYESSLADVEDGTTITIKGKVNGKDVTITNSLVKE